MKLHRFIGDYNLVSDQVEITDIQVLKQMKNVLRLKIGEQILLCDREGNEVLAKIIAFVKAGVSLRVLEKMENKNEPLRRVTLYCAVLKRENFELVCQKATEIGVKEIVPVITKRTVKLNLNLERLQKIMKEAAEQSGRQIVPVLHEPVEFGEAIEHARKNEVNYFFDIDGSAFVETLTGTAGLFIGAEGGWDDSEVKAVKKAGFQITTLGKLTLRAETAALVASYLVIGQ